MFVREYGLVQNSGDSERFVRVVKWEERWLPADVHGFEVYTLVPTVWEYRPLDRRLVPTAITEHAGRAMRSVYPSEAPTETEWMRRERILAIRQACHVSPAKGAEVPMWATPGAADLAKAVAGFKGPADFVADDNAAA